MRVTASGFPIRTPSDRRVLARSPRLIAGSCVLLRLLLPRHPPCALCSLTPIVFVSFPTRRLPIHSDSRCERTGTKSVPENQTAVTRPLASTFGVPDAEASEWTPKGGDPATGSPTATLLRLHPNRRSGRRRSPPYGWGHDFGHDQLSWCDGRCVQGPRTYSPRRSDARLLAISTS